MKTLSFALLLMASLAFVMLGCSDNPSTVLTPSEQLTSVQSTPASLGKKGPLVHAAQGSLNITLEGKNCVFTIAAHEFADGSVDGTYENNCANAFNLKFLALNGDVKEFKVDGNIAIILGQMKTTEYKGYWNVIPAIDNGQGGQDGTPDQTTYYVGWYATYEEAKAFFDQPAATIVEALIPIPADRGNVRVY